MSNVIIVTLKECKRFGDKSVVSINRSRGVLSNLVNADADYLLEKMKDYGYSATNYQFQNETDHHKFTKVVFSK